ncbi:uncharacterized protein Hap1MRO34_021102 isoform 2-T3 [Clarias gariepinus]
MATGAKVGAAGGIMSHPHLGNVQEFHDWDTGPEVDSVWIGFIDMVPVIGTVKEGVELVLALYEGNEAVSKEKEKVIENMVEESLQKHVKTLPGKPADADASGFSGLINVTEVRKEMIIQHMVKGSTTGTKPTSAEKEKQIKEIKTRVSEIFETMGVKAPQLDEKIKEEQDRAKRGEHVFNNGILKFHSKVLNAFVEKYLYELQKYDGEALDEFKGHTLPQNTAKDIGENMVVTISTDEFYVNVNALLYGTFSKALHRAMLSVLGCTKQCDVTVKDKLRVKTVVDIMNKYEIYVDHFAKAKWIANNGVRRFEEVRGQVVTMYENDRGLDWCLKILRVVTPWFVISQ